MTAPDTRDKIHKAIREVEQYYASEDRGPQPDSAASAVIEDGLRCRIASADGKTVFTDMPPSVGGSADFNSPGWLCRAAIASCDATLLAMRAAREGIELDSIEVRVESLSDGRGMFLDQGVSPASLEIRIFFDVRAANATRAQIEALVDWVCAHSPVANDIARATRVVVELNTE